MAGFDAHKNLAVSAVVTAPTPATSGTSLTVTTGEGQRFPAAPFNATVWPVNAMPTPLNGEVIRVTARATDVLTITRAQEGSTARAIGAGDLIAATVTAKTLTDLETRAALKDEANTFTQTQKVAQAIPRVQLVETAAPVNGRQFEITGYAQVLLFQALSDDASATIANPLTLDRQGNAVVGAVIRERGRSAAIGERRTYVPVATSAEGVALGGAIAGNYMLVGQTIFWSIFALSMSAGAPTAHIRFTAPPGYPPMAVGNEQASLRTSWSSGSPVEQWAYTEVDATYIKVFRSAAFPAGSGHIIGQGFYFTSSN